MTRLRAQWLLALGAMVVGATATVVHPSVSGSPEAPQTPRASEALIVGYGRVLEPPYTFSGMGSDTLWLNGLPYHVSQPPAARPVAPPEGEDPIYDLAKRLAALRDSVPPEALEAEVRALLLSVPGVESVYVEPGYGSAFVRFADHGDWIFARGHAGVANITRSLSERQQLLIDLFNTVVDTGGFLQFDGSGPPQAGNPRMVPRARALISALTAGLPTDVPDDEKLRRLYSTVSRALMGQPGQRNRGQNDH